MSNPMMLSDMLTFYVKPSMGGQIIMRKPRTRHKSERVRAAKILFANRASGNNIAGQCKGKKGLSFYGCLRTAGVDQFRKGRSA